MTEYVRPVDTLLEVVEYLRDHVVDQKPFKPMYDFVSDRMRQVVQELTIQKACCEKAVRCLQIISKFLIISVPEIPDEYWPHNTQHLASSLTMLQAISPSNEFATYLVIIAPDTFT
jgi:hypothetical protein